MGQALLLKGGNSGAESFVYSYTGQHTDVSNDTERIITLLTSGTLVVDKSVTASIEIQAGGGGGALAWNGLNDSSSGVDRAAVASSGGGGGKQALTDYKIAKGTYSIVVGSGGNGVNESEDDTGWEYTPNAGAGGDTKAFDITCTGGKGGYADINTTSPYYHGAAGAAGSPNATAGASRKQQDYSVNYDWTTFGTVSGGTPNGGSVTYDATVVGVSYVGWVANDGGDGYVKIVIPI